MTINIIYKIIETPDGEKFHIPNDIVLLFPKKRIQSVEINRLAFIPWEDKYIDFCPSEFRTFFKYVLPFLNKRTSDVHTAVSLSYTNELIQNYLQGNKINTKLVVLGLILHDCGWGNMSDNAISNSFIGYHGLKIDGRALNAKQQHIIAGLKIAKEVLSSYIFPSELTEGEKETVLWSVEYHDDIDVLRNGDFQIEIKMVADLDHLWSLSHLNFWQDTIRKQIEPKEYLIKLERELEEYFILTASINLAKRLLEERREEVKLLPSSYSN